jgi:hypothetical protein
MDLERHSSVSIFFFFCLIHIRMQAVVYGGAPSSPLVNQVRNSICQNSTLRVLCCPVRTLCMGLSSPHREIHSLSRISTTSFLQIHFWYSPHTRGRHMTPRECVYCRHSRPGQEIHIPISIHTSVSLSLSIYGDPSSWRPKGVAPLTNSLISLSVIESESISRQLTVAFGPHEKGSALTD